MRNRLLGVLAIVAAAGRPAPSGASTTPEGVMLKLPGYAVSSPFAFSLPVESSDIEIDASGALLVPMSDGIRRVTLGGITPWSSAVVNDLALAPDGSGYGAGYDALESFQSGGSAAVLHQDVSHWIQTTLDADGALYAASAWPGNGLYRVDRSTGDLTPLVAGGPGAGGDGTYGPMVFGSDGKLYMLGRSVNSADPGGTLFRLDGSQFTAVVSLSATFNQCTMLGLVRGPAGTLFAARYIPTVTGSFTTEVLILDPAAGTSSTLAFVNNHVAIGYDPSVGNLYVAEGTRLMKLWVVTRTPVPAQAETWGALKARYRGATTN